MKFFRRMVFISSVLLLLLSACSEAGQEQQPTRATVVAVDPLLREAYQTLGGEGLFGPALTTLFDYRGFKCQYLEAGLLCYDAMDSNHFKFMPLGIALNLKDPPDAPQGGPGLVVDGYTIYPAFEQVYQALQGERYFGRPLTQVRFDYSHRRVEQYFENLGLYQSMEDPQGEVHLLAYGVFACDSYCRYKPRPESAVIASRMDEQEIFLLGMNAVDLDVLGVPLTRPVTGSDGKLQQVYEGAVVYSPSGDPYQIALRPIVRWLGLPSDPPQAADGTAPSDYVFYPVQGDLGYYVLPAFDRFIAEHGGVFFSGAPVSKVTVLDASTLRQCFENYCLLYDRRGSNNLQVRFQALGVIYLQQFPVSEQDVLRPLYSPETILLTVSELKPRLPATEPQQVVVQVSQRSGLQPLVGVDGTLQVAMADGQVLSLPIPPTDEHGFAQVTIQPMPSLPNSTIVHYQVCVNLPSPEPICVWEDYYIWNYK
jgi:hypothetical protein